jgi:hypothetical protein
MLDLPIKDALNAVGDLLAVEEERICVVVVGGATLNLLGLVRRSTSDVDVIARAYRNEAGGLELSQAEPFPPALRHAIRTVARDFGLPAGWMNAEIGAQLEHGLPPWILDDITWRPYGALEVGLVGRRTLVALKLFAAVDRGPRSVHVQDLLALAPTDRELDEAAKWVAGQDASPEFPKLIEGAVEHVRSRRP